MNVNAVPCSVTFDAIWLYLHVYMFNLAYVVLCSNTDALKFVDNILYHSSLVELRYKTLR